MMLIRWFARARVEHTPAASSAVAGPVDAPTLSPAERRELGALCDGLDLRRVRIHRGGGGWPSRLLRAAVLRLSLGRGVTLGNQVFLPDACRCAVPVLAHELMHCAQYQQWGAVRYYLRGAAERLRELRYLLGLGPNPYRYVLEPGRPFEAYGMEQQGQIVEDCFRGSAIARAVSLYAPERTRNDRLRPRADRA